MNHFDRIRKELTVSVAILCDRSSSRGERVAALGRIYEIGNQATAANEITDTYLSPKAGAAARHLHSLAEAVCTVNER